MHGTNFTRNWVELASVLEALTAHSSDICHIREQVLYLDLPHPYRTFGSIDVWIFKSD